MAAGAGIGLRRRTRWRGRGPGDPRRAHWQPVADCVRSWPRSSSRSSGPLKQIAGWLKATYRNEAEMQVSHAWVVSLDAIGHFVETG